MKNLMKKSMQELFGEMPPPELWYHNPELQKIYEAKRKHYWKMPLEDAVRKRRERLERFRAEHPEIYGK